MKRGVLKCDWCGHPGDTERGPVWVYDADDERREPRAGEGINFLVCDTLRMHERCWATSAHLYDMPRRPGFGGEAQQLALELEAA